MLYSKLFPKASKQAPKDAESANAKFLVQGGFVHQEMAGVYSWLPLGLRVLNNVENIVREEINALGAQELLMPALQPRENWQTTKRWEGFDVLYKLQSKIGGKIALGPTHEEIVTPLVGAYISSYNDLPLALYQIQNKYRDELRAKSGVLRGREFGMKDLYSFHKDEADLETYYEKVAKLYLKIFKRLGLLAVRVRATGGAFSKFSDEFQVITESGEDTIYNCEKCKIYYNAELVYPVKSPDKSGVPEGQFNRVKSGKCTEGHKVGEGKKAIEVGNIFKLGTRFSDAFGLKFLDKDGKEKPIIMGCYGIGTTRLVGAIVEANHDEKGIIWPAEVAPFATHLIVLFGKDAKINKKIDTAAKKVCRSLQRDCFVGLPPRNDKKAVSLRARSEAEGVAIPSSLDNVLFDDRTDISAGEKFAVSDLLGIPERIIISEKTLAKNEMEIKDRKTGKVTMKKL